MNIFFNKKNIKLLYTVSILLYLTFAYVRSPEILGNGRFFAEEGAVWWSFSLSNSFLDTIQYVPTMQGYISLNTNIQVYLSTLVPINYSPLVTVWTSLLIAFTPSFLFLFLSENFYTDKYRIAASITILFLPSLNFLEVFANSINAQVYLAISCFIILLYGLRNNYMIKFQYLILLISFLSTYYSLILLPVFLIQFLRKRNKELRNSLIIGIFASFIQLNILFFAYTSDAIFSAKVAKDGLTYFLEILKLSANINFFGERFYRGSFLWVVTSLILLLIISFLIRKEVNLDFYSIIIISFFSQVFLIYFGQSGDSYSQRYAVVASTVIFFVIVHFLGENLNLNNLIFIFLIIGIFNFSYQGGKYFVDCDVYCVTWQEQLVNVENNETQILIHWPMGDGDPYWFTDIDNPKPNPSPFQKNNLGENYLKLYSYTFSDVILDNLITLNQK